MNSHQAQQSHDPPARPGPACVPQGHCPRPPPAPGTGWTPRCAGSQASRGATSQQLLLSGPWLHHPVHGARFRLKHEAACPVVGLPGPPRSSKITRWWHSIRCRGPRSQVGP